MDKGLFAALGIVILTIGMVFAANSFETGTSSDSNTTDVGVNDTGASASYDQTEHIGCQPGSIDKNGVCKVATSDQNADIFNATGLKPVVAENTTLGGTSGYLVRPADNETYPSVIMIHEWWGLNENIRHMADILAGHGYTVFAVDLYNGEVAENSSEAGKLSGAVRSNPDEAVQKMADATEALKQYEYSNGLVASLGWCFGGGQSLQLSLSDADLDSTIIYYGTLTTNETVLQNIDAPVLGIFGSEDRVVPVEDVRAFNSTLGDLGIEREVHVYEGAGHAFANPSGESFEPEYTKDAWTKTLNFLDENLKE